MFSRFLTYLRKRDKFLHIGIKDAVINSPISLNDGQESTEGRYANIGMNSLPASPTLKQ